MKNDPYSVSLCPEACYRQGYKAAGTEFKLSLCVLVTGEILHHQPTTPASELCDERKWLCWCHFPGDGAWSLLNLAPIAECVLCFGCICQRVQAHTGRDAYNTVIGGNQRGFFGAAGEMARFAQPLFLSVLTPFSSFYLSSSSITFSFF